MLLIILMSLMISCGTKEPLPAEDPSNLSVEVTISEDGSGKVDVLASADNSVEYRIYIDYADDPEEVNTGGEFTLVFTTFGFHHIEVRAYGSSGRFIKVEREIIIPGDNVSLDDGYTSPMEYTGFSLIWNDEFDGNIIKEQYWTFDIGDGCPNNCGWGNNELQYYKKDNARVGKGVLTIEARKESYQNKTYTSARIKTQGLKSFRYGRIDIRALMPAGQGMWPALWMLGNNITSYGWPACGEIDIMEMIGGDDRENTVHGTVHWSGNGGEHLQSGGSKSISQGTLADEYHVYSIIWDDSSVKWLLNNEEYYSISTATDDLSEFQQNFFLIFNLAVGGNWPGNPNTTTIFPQHLKIDYVRVFQVN